MEEGIIWAAGGGVLVLLGGAVGYALMWLRKFEHDQPVLRVIQDANLVHHHNFKNVGEDGYPTCVCGDRYTDAGPWHEGRRWAKDHWEAE